MLFTRGPFQNTRGPFHLADLLDFGGTVLFA